MEHNPEDQDGLRFALMESFRSWGIVPMDLNNYSVKSVMWQKLEEYHEHDLVERLRVGFRNIFGAQGKYNDQIGQYIEIILRENDRETIFNNIKALSALVHNAFDVAQDATLAGTEGLLGMKFGPITFELTNRATGSQFSLTSPERDVFQVYRCRPLIRHNPSTGNVTKQLLVTFLQKVPLNLNGTPYEPLMPIIELEDGAKKKGQYFFRGGSTVVLDFSTYEIKYVISKSISNSTRLQQQLDHELETMNANANAALMMQGKEPFAMVHSH
jgi:hypothetical protein